MALLKFDRINKLEDVENQSSIVFRNIRKHETFDEYFGEVELTDKQKKVRVELAKKLEDLMLTFFIFCEMQRTFGNVDTESQYQYLVGRYMNIVIEHTSGRNPADGIYPEYSDNPVSPNYVKEFVEEKCRDIVDVTNKKLDEIQDRNKQKELDELYGGNSDSSNNHSNNTKNNHDDWWLSDDRAFILAADGANVIGNYEDFSDAINSGYTMKQWCDVRDNKERDSHRDVGGTIIPITDPFRVGDSYMMFPMDKTTFDADDEEIINCRCYLKFV